MAEGFDKEAFIRQWMQVSTRKGVVLSGCNVLPEEGRAVQHENRT